MSWDLDKIDVHQKLKAFTRLANLKGRPDLGEAVTAIGKVALASAPIEQFLKLPIPKAEKEEMFITFMDGLETSPEKATLEFCVAVKRAGGVIDPRMSRNLELIVAGQASGPATKLAGDAAKADISARLAALEPEITELGLHQARIAKFAGNREFLTKFMKKAMPDVAAIEDKVKVMQATLGGKGEIFAPLKATPAPGSEVLAEATETGSEVIAEATEATRKWYQMATHTELGEFSGKRAAAFAAGAAIIIGGAYALTHKTRESHASPTDNSVSR